MTYIHDLLQRAALKQPDHLAIRNFDDTDFTYGTLLNAVTEAASILRQCGTMPGDRVMVIGETSVSMVSFVLAASQIDAWLIPVNARMADGEVERIVQHAQPRTIVITEDASPDAQRHREKYKAEVTSGLFGTVSYANPFASQPELLADSPDDQVAVLIYTTGTTGDPKGVMLTHTNLVQAGLASVRFRDMKSHDLVYCALPLTHVFGMATLLMSCLVCGASLWYSNKFRPAHVLEALDKGVTVLPAVPQMHIAVLHHAESSGRSQLASKHLRYTSSGAAPLDASVKREAEAFYGVTLQNGYGMTETSAGICGTNHQMGSPDISVGAPIEEVCLKIAGESRDSSRHDPDHVGEILVKGPVVMKGYYKNPQATKDAFTEDGYFKTGDLARRDENGNIHIVGRSKELIIRSGFNVYPPEVEGAISDHPDILHAAVLGRKNEQGNEDIFAFVERKAASNLTAKDLQHFLKNRLTAYKRPTHIVFVDKMPAAASGKILKHQLQNLFDQAQPS